MSDLTPTNNDLASVLQSHFTRYPAMTAADAVKLCYQSAFGGGHLITDPQKALAWILRERAEIGIDETRPLFEDIGNGILRLNLNASDASALSDDLILRLFVASAQRISARKDNDRRFASALSVLKAMADEGHCPFDGAALDAYLFTYRADGCPAVHHSADYNAQYHPAYRVIDGIYASLLPVLCALETRLIQRDALPVTVALDGCAASGKSTLTEALSLLYDCNVFHMDDYFLPVSMRTSERLSAPGGNVHYERFQTEILDGIRSGVPFSYTPYDCSQDKLAMPVAVTPKRVNLIEGSYALHPYFGDTYDIRAAVTCGKETQLARIRRRNGEPLYSMFVSRWIPMEETYFAAFGIFADSRNHIIQNE